MVFENLPKSYDDGNDMLAREKMLNAASIAGLGFGNSQVVVGHSLAHSFGAVFHITHGIAVGVFLPYVMEFVCNNSDNQDSQQILADAAKSLGIVNFDSDKETASKEIIKKIRELQKRIDFPQTLKELGIEEDKLNEKMDMLVELVNESSSSLMTPRGVENEDIIEIIKCAFDGKNVMI
jgi:alcohol dehydrogenase class IV